MQDGIKCKFNHSHPPKPLKAATRNPARPHGPRPYHCPDCPQVAKPQVVGANWIQYADAEQARAAGHPRACSQCFPAAASKRSTASAGSGGARAAAITADDLMRWHRELLRLLDTLDARREPGAGPAARIRRLRDAQVIARKIAALMLSVTEARNATLHEGDEPTAAEGAAIMNAWTAIRDWARTRGANG